MIKIIPNKRRSEFKVKGTATIYIGSIPIMYLGYTTIGYIKYSIIDKEWKFCSSDTIYINQKTTLALTKALIDINKNEA